MIELEEAPVEVKESRLVYWNTFFGRIVYKNLDTHEYWWEGGQVVVKA